MNGDGPIDPERLLAVLVDEGVVATADDGLRLVDEFEDDVQRRRERFEALDREEVRGELAAATDSGDVLDAMLDVPSVAASYVALSEAAGLTHPQRLRVVSLLDSMIDPPPDEGAPEAFLPVSGDHLPFHVAINERSIVYVWRHDCPPCDVVRDDLDDAFETPPDDLALFAVYGPDAATRLQELYDVPGGPATLFFYRGTVDARLYGAYHDTVLQNEIERHRAPD